MTVTIELSTTNLLILGVDNFPLNFIVGIYFFSLFLLLISSLQYDGNI